VHHALTTGDGLEQLEMLGKVAADTPAMRAMLAKTKGLLEERSKQSPVIALLKTIGVDVRDCQYWMWLGSRNVRNHTPTAQVNFNLDSRAQPSVHVSIDGSSGETSWNEEHLHRDALGFGRPELATLPDYFARAAQKLHVTWSWDEASVYSSLRGKKRAAVLQWLRSGRG